MKSISAFDLDHTLVRSNCSSLFFRYLIKKGIIHPLSIFTSLFYKAQYDFFGLELQDLHHKVFKRFLKGKSLDNIQMHVREFLKQDFYKHLYFPAFDHLRRAQHEGHHTVIISNSPSFLVEPVAEYLCVDEWYSSHYITDEQGVLKDVGPILLGEGKATYLRKMISRFKTKPERTTAYSDSVIDLPFLHAAGKAIVVNPCGKLRRFSEEHKWEVI